MIKYIDHPNANKNVEYYKGIPYISKNGFNKGDASIVGQTILNSTEDIENKQIQKIVYNESHFEVKKRFFGKTLGYIELENEEYVVLKQRYKINYIAVTICLLCLMIIFSMSNAHGYSSEYDGGNAHDTSGGFYFEIRGGPSGNSRIHFNFKRKSGATSYNSIMNNTSSWAVSIYGPNSTNRHNISIVDTTISTKLDVTNSYNVLSFRIAYDMPAHYQYSSYTADAPDGMRMNVLNYNKENSGSNSASASGGHSGSTTRRTMNIQVNTGNTGLRTYKKYWYYNCTLAMNIVRPNRTVTFTNGLGTTLKTQSVACGNSASAPANPTRTGYTFAGWDRGYTGVCSNITVNARWNINYYYLDLNGWLDGVSNGGLGGYGTADVYVNGSLVANDVSDYYAQHRYGSTYQITDIRTSSGHSYNGVYSGSLSGTINGNKSVVLSFSTSNYTNYIGHWAGGFVHGEGNNGGKNMYNLANTTFSAKYGSTYSMNSSKQTTIPKGFYLGSAFGSPSINGSWGSYNIGTSVTQKANSMSYEYYYYPYTYSISYNLDGGTNNSSNPNSYNVLYGVTLANPTRKGYEFLGWYNGDTKVTGINQGANASFTSANDMYSKLNSRTTGNVTLTAKWKYIVPPVITAPVNTKEDTTPFYDKICNYLVIKQGENFEALNFAIATDEMDGDITSKIKVIKNEVPLTGGKANVAGIYEVVYEVTNSNDITATQSIHVFVNENPKISVQERYLIKDNTHTVSDILSKVLIFDKEEGIIFNGSQVKDDYLTSITENLGKADKTVIKHIQKVHVKIKDSDNEIVNIDNEFDKVNIDHLNKDQYEIELNVDDSHFGTATSSFTIHFVNQEILSKQSPLRTPRYVAKNTLSSLSAQSIWQTNPLINSLLVSSLNREVPLYSVEFTSSQLKSIRNRDIVPSQEANRQFVEQHLGGLR